VHYSATLASEDHFALPKGATWNPVSDGQYVTGLAVEFSSSNINSRPRVDLPISHEHRDYTAVDLIAETSSRVPNSNFNLHYGGATVAIILDRMTNAADGLPDSDHSKRAAITRVTLADEHQVAGYVRDGFTLIDKNLLEQSNRGTLYLMYMRGSGAPVLDIQTTPTAGYEKISGTSSKGATIHIYVRYSRDNYIKRTLNWTPCSGQDEEIVVCAAVSTWNSSHAMSSNQQCILLDVVPTKPPEFVEVPGSESDRVLQASMGKLLAIEMRIRRTDNPLSSLETVPTIRFSAVNGQPEEQEGVAALLTGRTPTLARIVQPNRRDLGLAPREDAGDSSLKGEFSGFIEWIPSPYQGGWEGKVCVEACLSLGVCPAAVGSHATEECQEQCYHVAVARCKWSLQDEDALVEIAPRFQTNWLQLWYLNPFMAHPDHASTLSAAALGAGVQAQPGQPLEINVGRIYHPLWDDTLDSVAQRFGMTSDRLKQVNADLLSMQPSDMFAEWKKPASNSVATEVCIIPDSCQLG